MPDCPFPTPLDKLLFLLQEKHIPSLEALPLPLRHTASLVAGIQWAVILVDTCLPFPMSKQSRCFKTIIPGANVNPTKSTLASRSTLPR